MDRVGLERTTPAGLAVLAAVLGAMAWSGWTLFRTGSLPLQLGGAALWLVTAGIALVARQGGVIEDDEEVQERQQQQRQQQQTEGQQTAAAGGKQAAA
jgi:hypothetical protein